MSPKQTQAILSPGVEQGSSAPSTRPPRLLHTVLPPQLPGALGVDAPGRRSASTDVALVPFHSLQRGPKGLPLGPLPQRCPQGGRLRDTGLPGQGLQPRASDRDVGCRVSDKERRDLPGHLRLDLWPLYHHQPGDCLWRMGQTEVHLQRRARRVHHRQQDLKQ